MYENLLQIFECVQAQNTTRVPLEKCTTFKLLKFEMQCSNKNNAEKQIPSPLVDLMQEE